MVGEPTVEVVPAVLRRTWEGIQEDWNKLANSVPIIQIDITDGVFAGDGTFRELRMFKQLPGSERIELHLMVHTPSNFVADIIDLSPARCIFHLESFEGTHALQEVYTGLRQETNAELALALNPDTPVEWLDEHLEHIDYVLFMGYNPGFAGQDIDERVYRKLGTFHDQHPEVPIAVDGHVDKTTIPSYVSAGARRLCANSSIFKHGDPMENHRQLTLLAQQSLAT